MLALRYTVLLILSVIALLTFSSYPTSAVASSTNDITYVLPASESENVGDLEENACTSLEVNAFLADDSLPALDRTSRQADYGVKGRAMPDGPVQEIEHPPRLDA